MAKGEILRGLSLPYAKMNLAARRCFLLEFKLGGRSQHMHTELTRYSRDGDMFHYRWAARRCLELIRPKSALRQVVVEGSSERKRPGEYVIDITEEYEHDNSIREVRYFQLKHTTVQGSKPFTLSDLKTTIQGFSKRYISHIKGRGLKNSGLKIAFVIVTNRPFSCGFKNNLRELVQNGKTISRFEKTMEEYTSLKGIKLRRFCKALEIQDEEGDYNDQEQKLRVEMSTFMANSARLPHLNSLTELIHKKALSNTDGKINPEEILNIFGASSYQDFLPAPAEFETENNLIEREQYSDIQTQICSTNTPIIIHAVGGVGKSVAARYLARTLPKGSFGIVYDCFGGGKYRNRSQTRHQHRDGLVQIINELAFQGLCGPLLPTSGDSEKDFMRAFLSRMETAIDSLRTTQKDAYLCIFIDAADNAEMAAEEFSQPSFVNELLREDIPEGLRLIALCRTERRDLLKPSDSIVQIELSPFSPKESLTHLRQYFPNTSEHEGEEFHRLSNNGNPRVQSTALTFHTGSLLEVLNSLGPNGATVDSQISELLKGAVSKIKDALPVNYQGAVDSICTGLASLPPFIPIAVLATASNTDPETIKSFVADFGRALWFSDDSVQFKDEPTETWFRKSFSTTPGKIGEFVTLLTPMASMYSYVAEALPALLLQAEKYNELIELALSDKALPEDNPVDRRNIRLMRLQFSFHAALKHKNYNDAIKIGFLAGEEMAGNDRQIQLLKDNIDLLSPLQSGQRVQGLAFRHQFRGVWNGSENVFSASLLSTVNDFSGEAKGYLRSALNWLNLYLEEPKENNDYSHQEKLADDEILELVSTHYHLFGVESAVDFLLRWQPPDVIFLVGEKFTSRLIDAGRFEDISKAAEYGSPNEHFILALTRQLRTVGRFPEKDVLQESLQQCLNAPRSKNGNSMPYVSFFEACVYRNVERDRIHQWFQKHPIQVPPGIMHYPFLEQKHDEYFRAMALRSVLSGDPDLDVENLFPDRLKKSGGNNENEIKKFKEIINALFPWYLICARLLARQSCDVLLISKKANERSKKSINSPYGSRDSLPNEVAATMAQVFVFMNEADLPTANKYYKLYIKGNKNLYLQARIKMLRAAFRLEHLSNMRDELEQFTYKEVTAETYDSPESKAESFIDLARAVLLLSPDGAKAYFDEAIEAVSKFGDELPQRWLAIAALGKRVSENIETRPEIAYRFIRCAELVGENLVREKYWNRGQAMEICTRMSSGTGLAALSRWRDRNIGWFEGLLHTVIDHLVVSCKISPIVGASLSPFLGESNLKRLAQSCIKKASTPRLKKIILEKAVQDLQLHDMDRKDWSEFKSFLQKFGLQSNVVDEIVTFFETQPKRVKQESCSPHPRCTTSEETPPPHWCTVFGDIDLLTENGIVQAHSTFKKLPNSSQYKSDFWDQVYMRIQAGRGKTFLQQLIQAKSINFSLIQDALSKIPQRWKDQISIKKYWPQLLKDAGFHFPYDFTNHNNRRGFFSRVVRERELQRKLCEGVASGLQTPARDLRTEDYFGCIEILTPLVTSEDALPLLQFGMDRFGSHIEKDFGDGPWDSWLTPPDDMSQSLTGILWAAFGSPDASTRWRAAHCTRRLGEFGCQDEIDALIDWMDRDEAGPFGCKTYPFYSLHARLYLLISFARISLEHPEAIRSHYQVFSDHALNRTPHVLLKKFAVDIAQNIEKAFPGTYQTETLKNLNKINISPFPILNANTYQRQLDTPWHQQEAVNTSLRFFHGLDMPSYWYQPLGRVFGVSQKQIEELVTEVIFGELGAKTDEYFLNDPRKYSRGEYPLRIQSNPKFSPYSFYLTYHAMMIVAGRLLNAMPVVHSSNRHEDEWAEWLSRHLLTRSDGHWVSDRRDPPPLLRPSWIYQEPSNDWDSQSATTTNFLDGLIQIRNGEPWITVTGSTLDDNSDRTETISISSALVSPSTAQSLLNALTSCKNPYNFKLPSYQENDMEFRNSCFKLQGWIYSTESCLKLDEFDPHACELPYPPYKVGEEFAEKLGLTTNLEQREWVQSDCVVLINEIWSSYIDRSWGKCMRQGNRLCAKLNILKTLCTLTQSELIIEVQISRSLPHGSRRGNNEFKPPKHKIFVFSSDGRLRDASSYFRIGKSSR